MYKSIKTTKLVQPSTQHYSLFVVRHVGTAWLDTSSRVETRDVT